MQITRDSLDSVTCLRKKRNSNENFKDIKQAFTANQIDIIPTEIIDRTLDDVKKASPILKLVNMAPANVKKWIVASHSGAAVWGPLTDAIKGELSAEVTALNIDLHKLTAYLVIPKSIRELSMEFVDRYFMAILSEAMQDGLVKGYLDGDGKTGPIGIFRQIGTVESAGTNKAKTVLTTVTKFSPKGLAPVRKLLLMMENVWLISSILSAIRQTKQNMWIRVCTERL